MKRLMFTNPGQLDPRLISTFGVNVKPHSESAIGFFGTGLKYAIAITLRLGGSLEIHTGHRVHSFIVDEETIRGKEFKTINMVTSDCGRLTLERLGFTLDLGKTWEPWMAYREFWANARDEGGEVTVFEGEGTSDHELDSTMIVINCPVLLEVFENRANYFLVDDPLWSNGEVEIHPASASIICYQGIRMLARVDDKFKAMYTYNLVTSQKLTEDRTLVSHYEAKADIGKAIVRCDDRDIIEQVLGVDTTVFEWDLDFDWPSLTPSAEFCEVVFARLRRRDRVSSSARAMVRRYKEDEYKAVEVELPETFSDMAKAEPEAPVIPEKEFVSIPYSYYEALEQNIVKAMAQAKYWRRCAAKLAGEPEPTESPVKGENEDGDVVI